MSGPVGALDARARAIARQAEAADPVVSAFVEASAGSGKTKLLTDRMLRLMLGGAPPGRIQCLTFTKAAAAEMAVRLQTRLGAWVTLDETALDGALRGLELIPDAALRARARALFAEVLDLAGGMRIGTIHAFCQSLLRRFPLEAAISPHFELVEDAEAAAALLAARERAMAEAAPGPLATVAGLVSAEGFAQALDALRGRPEALDALLRLAPDDVLARLRRATGCTAPDDAAVLQAAVDWPAAADCAAVLRLAQQGSKAVAEKAGQMLGWLSLPPAQRAVHWQDWVDHLFKESGSPRSASVFAADRLDQQFPQIRVTMIAEQERVFAVEDARRAVRCVAATSALLSLAGPAMASYADGKARDGLLDYADLIGSAERLLEDPGAAWVLYKLDGGIDHLLLDEVQDTSPEQWRIAHRLTEEFFAGLGARDATTCRTFFAVGDPKQSIYSFQGADPAQFGQARAAMAARVGRGGQVWRDVALDVSFRSTAPVLDLVDAVFADPIARQGVAEAGGLRHLADRSGAAGRVELWPLVPHVATPKALHWSVPDANQGLTTAPQQLADGVAAAIAEMLARGERLESADRPIAPGDILILVRKRKAFATALVRALKARGVPVAGLDRMMLTEQVAVQDLLAACEAVLLPEDDLAVACVLTSPLGGLSDDGLMALLLRRQAGVWETLRRRAAERADWRAAWDFLSVLAARADYVTPHALLVEALGALGGRARLLGRLGAEAAEPIDELLTAALQYGQRHAPSLQGFVHWVRQSGAMVKREAGGAGAVVRVMTAHGAKGLQAPVVFLPDTNFALKRADILWGEADGAAVPLWVPNKTLRCSAAQRAASRADALALQEENRLLYVALTRAEDRLIVCGWHVRTPPAETSWYELVRRGFDALGAASLPLVGGWEGELRVVASPQTDPPRDRVAGAVEQPSALPGWVTQPAPAEPALAEPLAPSRPEGAAWGAVPAALSPLVAGTGPRFARGAAVHALLQHLPGLPAGDRAAAGAAWLRQGSLSAEAQAAVLDQVLAILAHPELAEVFGPLGRAEQPLSGVVVGRVISGVVDRLAVLPDRVLVAEFKTGRAAPDTVQAAPVRYLRQLAAYRAVLRQLFPERRVVCALVWVDAAEVQTVPETLLEEVSIG